MKKKILSLLFTTSIILFTNAQTNKDIIGVWEASDIIDNIWIPSKKGKFDFIEFEEDGTITLVYGRNRILGKNIVTKDLRIVSTSFKYRINKNLLEIDITSTNKITKETKTALLCLAEITFDKNRNQYQLEFQIGTIAHQRPEKFNENSFLFIRNK